MSKISKKMFDDYNNSKKVVKESKKRHQKNVDSIVKVIKPIISKYYENERTGWRIEGVSFMKDEYMYDKKQNQIVSKEYEWIEITEDEYYDLICDGKSSDELKEDFKNIRFYKREKKKFDFLRVYVHEYWGYGGYDDVVHDFLLSDIMYDTYLRKEKLKRLRLEKMKELSSFLDDELNKIKKEREMREDAKKYNL